LAQGDLSSGWFAVWSDLEIKNNSFVVSQINNFGPKHWTRIPLFYIPTVKLMTIHYSWFGNTYIVSLSHGGGGVGVNNYHPKGHI